MEELILGQDGFVPTSSASGDTHYVFPYTAQKSGKLTKIYWYPIAYGNVKLSIYDTSGGVPTNLLWSDDTDFYSNGNEWCVKDLGEDGPEVIEGNQYALGFCLDRTGNVAYKYGPAFPVYYKSVSYPSFTAPATISGYSYWTPNRLFATAAYGETAEPPTLTSIYPSSIKNSQSFTIIGSNLMGMGATVEVGDNSDYELANKYGLEIASESDSEIIAIMDNDGAFYGPGWIFVTNSYAKRSDPYLITILESTPSTLSGGDFVGHGHQPFGRHCFGGMQTDFEPRFIDSTPSDDSTGISVLFVAAKTEIYCFSSRIQDIYVEVSEGGSAFVDAYVNGAFVSPYDAPDSFVDFHQADPQKTIVKIEKDVPWDENIEVVIRVTATDQFGNEATKELPVIW